MEAAAPAGKKIDIATFARLESPKTVAFSQRIHVEPEQLKATRHYDEPGSRHLYECFNVNVEIY